MRSVRASRWCVALMVSACVAMSAGCGGDKKTAGEKRSDSAVSGLHDTRAELVSAKGQIDKTVASMNAMRDGQGDLKKEFATFNDDVKAMESRAEKARSRSADMKARAAQYQAKWREEMAKVDDPALREAASARTEKVRQRYDGIAAKATEARAAYDPFMKQLKSVQTYLSNDLTDAGVKAAAPVFDKATADAKTVQSKIDAVIAELDDVATSLTPAGTAAQPAKK